MGYEYGISQIQPGDGTRVARVLERAFPKPCFELVFETFAREDLGPSVVKGQVDVGVASIVSAEAFARKELNSMGQLELRNLETVLLTPASFSVVSLKEPEAQHHSLYSAVLSSPWMAAPVGALGGVLALLVGVFLLNFRLPRLDRYFERATTRLDPLLTGFLRTLEWVYGSPSGRVFALVWAAIGVAVTVPAAVRHQLEETQAQMAGALTQVTGATTRAADAPAGAGTAASEPGSAPESELETLREGAELAAYPGRHVYELRSGRWIKCNQPFQCFRNYEDGKSKALAGDRDLLCRQARETQAAKLAFHSSIGIPMVYAVMLRSEHRAAPAPAPGAAPSPTARVLAALSQERYACSPSEPCPLPARPRPAGCVNDECFNACDDQCVGRCGNECHNECYEACDARCNARAEVSPP